MIVCFVHQIILLGGFISDWLEILLYQILPGGFALTFEKVQDAFDKSILFF
jgi:hypothetical protein